VPIPLALKRKLQKRARRLKNQGRLKGTVDAYVWGAWNKIEGGKKA